MVVRIGPFPFCTTFSSGASAGAAGAAGAGSVSTALAVLSAGETEQPVITAAAPPTALRIRKLRRSTPWGTSCAIKGRVSANGSVAGAAVEPDVSEDLSTSLFDI